MELRTREIKKIKELVDDILIAILNKNKLHNLLIRTYKPTEINFLKESLSHSERLILKEILYFENTNDDNIISFIENLKVVYLIDYKYRSFLANLYNIRKVLTENNASIFFFMN